MPLLQIRKRLERPGVRNPLRRSEPVPHLRLYQDEHLLSGNHEPPDDVVKGSAWSPGHYRLKKHRQ